MKKKLKQIIKNLETYKKRNNKYPDEIHVNVWELICLNNSKKIGIKYDFPPYKKKSLFRK